MKIINFRALEKGVLRGFFDVVIEEWGMTIACSYFDKDGKKWVNLPNREYEKDGVKKYQSLVKFDEARHKKFQDKVLGMIEAGDYENLVMKQQITPQSPLTEEDCPF